MTGEEYELWVGLAVPAYARDRAAATGVALDVSLAQAEAQFPLLLPQGQDTPGAWLLVVEDESGQDVGSIWLAVDAERSNRLYLWDLYIRKPYRGAGLGRAAMLACETFAVQAGAEVLGLNVFGTNLIARGLYKSLGYEATSVEMSKRLAPGRNR